MTIGQMTHAPPTKLADPAAARPRAGAAAPVLLAQEPAARWPAAAGGAPRAVGAGAIEFMGGRRLFKQLPQSRAEIHGTLVKGLPYAVLVHIVDHLSALSADQIADALGISGRTLRRQKEQPDKPMPAHLASKTRSEKQTSEHQ